MKKFFFLPIAIVALMVASCGQTTEEVTTESDVTVDSVEVETVEVEVTAAEEIGDSTVTN